MNKATLTMIGATLLFSTAVRAQDAAIKPYASIKAVMTKTDAEFWNNKRKFKPKGANIAVGLTSGKNLRVEAEYGYREKKKKTEGYFIDYGAAYENGQETMELSSSSYMLNGYYDFHNESKLTPYLGAGIGLAKVTYDYSESVGLYEAGTGALLGSYAGVYRASKTKMAYALMAGAGWQIDDRLTIDAGFRYVDYGSFSDRDGDKYKTKAKELSVGLRYAF